MHAYLIVPLQQLPCTRMPDNWCTCKLLQCVAVCCSALQCVAVCCSVLQQLQYATVCCTRCSIRVIQMLFAPTLYSSVVQSVVKYCSVLQCATECYSVLQRVATVATYVYIWHICKTPFLNKFHTADPKIDLQAEAKHSVHTEKTFRNHL